MALVFDTREYLDALEPPVFRHGGREVVGGFVSWDQYLRFQHRLGEWERAPKDARDVRVLRRIMRDYIRAIFPRPWWAPWRTDVWRALRALPFAVQVEAFRSFLRSQATAHTPRHEPESVPDSAQQAPPPPLGMEPPTASGTAGGGENGDRPSPP